MSDDYLGEIAKALAAAQAEMSNPVFDSSNPNFKSQFASLAAVRNAVVPVLARHGVTVSQDLQTVESGVAVYTILTHESGQQMRFGPLTMPVSKADAQGVASASTYGRRYHLMAVCAVVGDDDDDGARATAYAPAKSDPPITDEQVANLEALVSEVGADAAAFLKYMKADALASIRASQYADAVNALRRKGSHK